MENQFQSSSNILRITTIDEPKMIRNIMVIDNLVDDEWCQFLINKFNIEEESQFQSRVNGNEDGFVKLTKLYTLMQDNDDWPAIKKEISNMMIDVYSIYRFLIPFPILKTGLPIIEDTLIELPTIKRYLKTTDERIGPHSDTYMRDETGTKIYKGDRYLNILVYLNDVEEGGETEFYFDNQTISVKPKMGRCVVFPPLWTHVHAGKPAISEDKYIMNGYLRAKTNG